MGVSWMRSIFYLTLITECVYANKVIINSNTSTSDSNDSNNKNISSDGLISTVSPSSSIAATFSSFTAKDFRNSSKINEIQTTTVPAPTRRKIGVDRDNKLMSVLQARRTALTRGRYRKEFGPIKHHKLLKDENLVEDSSTPESNLIIPNGKEEIFDTDETVHGMFVVNPRTGKEALEEKAPQIKLAKETNNYISNSSNKTSSTKLTPTKTTSPTRTYYEARAKRTRDRKTLVLSTEKSLEEANLPTYSNFGQKIQVSTKQSDSRNQVVSTKRTKEKLKDDSLEILEVSAPKAATEKSKFWQNRIANQQRSSFNPYMRRQKSEPVTSTTETTIVKFSTVNDTSITNLSDGVVDEKTVFSRSANVTKEEPKNHKSFFPSSGISGIGKLIINIPDDATPEVLFQPSNNYENTEMPETHVTIQISESPTAFEEEIVETTQANLEEFEMPRTFVSIPDINHIFQNLSTTDRPSSSSSRQKDAVIIIYPGTFTPSNKRNGSRTTTNTTTETPDMTTINRIEELETTMVIEEDNITTYMDQNGTDLGFNPILSHIFPKLTGMTSKRPTVMNFSVNFTTTPTTAATITTAEVPTTKKPEDAVLLQHNSDVVIEMRKMNTATFVLAGLGMLPIIIIVLYVIKAVLFKKENKVTRDLERYIPDGQPPISPVVRLEQSETSSSTDESIMTDHDFNRKNLRFKSLLGEGNFGQVWKAEADDLAGHLGTTRIVAVKTERTDNGHGDLKAEAEIMKKLGSHPNVVTLLGACLEQEPHLLIMEYAMRGRLLSLLRAARGAVNGLAPSVHNNRPPIMPLSPRRLTGFAHDIARGMEYIAEKKIVHRDLAARNVLLDHNGICKICDFGMSVDLEKAKHSNSQIRIPRVQPSESRFRFDLTSRAFGIGKHSEKNQDTKCRPALPIRWMAPEALQYHIFSRETDVWAFGIVMWEIATLGCTPYPALSGREVVRNVPNGARPEIPPDCRPELYDLMQRTWRKDPRQRPSFSEARITLARTLCQWSIEENDTSNTSEYLDVSGFSEDLEQGMVYFNRRISEFECEI